MKLVKTSVDKYNEDIFDTTELFQWFSTFEEWESNRHIEFDYPI